MSQEEHASQSQLQCKYSELLIEGENTFSLSRIARKGGFSHEGSTMPSSSKSRILYLPDTKSIDMFSNGVNQSLLMMKNKTMSDKL